MEYLIVEMIDRIELSNWLIHKANFTDDMPMPDKFPRPGIKPTEPEDIVFASNEEVINALSFNF